MLFEGSSLDGPFSGFSSDHRNRGSLSQAACDGISSRQPSSDLSLFRPTAFPLYHRLLQASPSLSVLDRTITEDPMKRTASDSERTISMRFCWAGPAVQTQGFISALELRSVHLPLNLGRLVQQGTGPPMYIAAINSWDSEVLYFWEARTECHGRSSIGWQ